MREARYYLFVIVLTLLILVVGATVYAAWDVFKMTAIDTIDYFGLLLKIGGALLVAAGVCAVCIQVGKLWHTRHCHLIRPGRYGETQAVFDTQRGVVYMLPTGSARKNRHASWPETQVIPAIAIPDASAQRALLPTMASQQLSEPPADTPPPAPHPIDLADLPWHPTADTLFLATTMQGLLCVPIDLAWHIILAGPTGHGKTNILRLLLLQLVPFYAVYLINPHYADLKATKPGQEPEDWRPIRQYLPAYPDKTKDEIKARLEWAVREIDERARREECGDHQWQNHYVFIAIDEYPEVKKRCSEAPELLATIVRRGRHYKVILINTSQDMLIKTIGGTSGDRNQYNTVFNVGCDDSSARALKVKIEDIPEEMLGVKGLSIIRAKLEERALTVLGRVPYVSNKALYQHLGFVSIEDLSGNTTDEYSPPDTPFPSPLSPSVARETIQGNGFTMHTYHTTGKAEHNGKPLPPPEEALPDTSLPEIPTDIRSRILAAAETQLTGNGKIVRSTIAKALKLEGRKFWMVTTVLNQAGYVSETA